MGHFYKTAGCFAVMGNPVAHSLSPFIHYSFAQQINLPLVYEKIWVEEGSFEERVFCFFEAGGRGLNITLPFKQRAFAIADRKTRRCAEAKAANTLWMKDGQLYADNTDGIGLIRDLSRRLILEGKRVLLLGAGGAARGIIPSLLTSNIAKLVISNRTIDKAKLLQANFKQIEICGLADAKGSFDLIINATSASLSGASLKLPSSILQSSTYCYDLTYRLKGNTPFAQWALDHGCRATDGIGLLVEQAAEAFFIWHGQRPDPQRVLTRLTNDFQRAFTKIERPSYSE